MKIRFIALFLHPNNHQIYMNTHYIHPNINVYGISGQSMVKIRAQCKHSVISQKKTHKGVPLKSCQRQLRVTLNTGFDCYFVLFAMVDHKNGFKIPMFFFFIFRNVQNLSGI